MIQSMGVQSQRKPPRETYSRRSSAAKAAILTVAAMNAVTGVGAPWYTSGVHWWNGTAAILNNRPTMTRAMPTATSVPSPGLAESVSDSVMKLTDPL